MTATRPLPLVVKLGGSTASAPELDMWLCVLADCGRPIVIVPGGGPFADFIRDSQASLGFSDIAAHAMAILAMEQFGHLLADRQSRLRGLRELSELRSELNLGEPLLWLPAPAVLEAADIPMSWTVTSDSIAAWLCGKIGATRLLLIKQSDAVRPGMSIEQLTADGIVDPQLISMLPSSVELHVAGPSHLANAEAALREGTVPGISIGSTSALKMVG